MNGDVDMTSAYNHDETDIRTENHGDLGRSGDFMDVDSSEEEPCIKCNRCDENLLVCSQSGCPISVHENCLSSGVKFDDAGNFYCPYCWYKRELMRTKELRKKAMEKKKQLACFIDSKCFSGDKEEENCRTDKGMELNISSLCQDRNYGYDGCEDRTDDVQVENLIMEEEGELENDRDNAKAADSCDKFKRALDSQSDPLAVHSHPGDKINYSQEKTPGIESLVREKELLKGGDAIPVEDLGHVNDSGQEKIVEDILQEELHTASCDDEENAVDTLLNLSKVDVPETENLKEGRREEEEKIDPRTPRSEMSDSDIEPISMRLRCVAGSSKKAQSRGVDLPKKLPSSKGANRQKTKGANIQKTKSQNVDSSKKLSNIDTSKKLSPPKGANPGKIAQARNEKSTASIKPTQVSGGKL